VERQHPRRMRAVDQHPGACIVTELDQLPNWKQGGGWGGDVVENNEAYPRAEARSDCGDDLRRVMQWKRDLGLDNVRAGAGGNVLSRLADCGIDMIGEQDFISERQLQGGEDGVAACCCVFDEDKIRSGTANEIRKPVCRLTQRSRQVERQKSRRVTLHALLPAPLF